MQTNNDQLLSIWFNPDFITYEDKKPLLQTKLKRRKKIHKHSRYPSRKMSRFPTEQLQRDFLVNNNKKHA